MSLEHPKQMKPLKYMRELAGRVLRELAPFTDRIEIAGSIRRCVPQCGDIEIVCIPKIRIEPVETALFPIDESVNLLEKRFSAGDFKAVIKNGSRYKQVVLKDGTYLDCFITNPVDYGRQLAIRTGSSNYSKMLAGIWVKKGWVGTEDGLRRRDQCKEVSGKWISIWKEPTLPPKFKTERDFFEFLGISMLSPNFRNK